MIRGLQDLFQQDHTKPVEVIYGDNGLHRTVARKDAQLSPAIDKDLREDKR